MQRQERFQQVMPALERLFHWAMSERHAFMVRTMGIAPPRSKRVAQSLDKDLPCVDNAEVSGLHALDEEEEEIQQDSCELEVEEVEVKFERCSFVRKPAVDKNSAVGDANHSLVDMLPDSIISSASVADAALELDFDRGQLPKSFAAQDIVAVLTACSEQANISGQMHEEANSEHMDTDSESSVHDESIDCPPAHPVNMEDPVIGRFMERSALKFMESVQENQLKSAAQQIQERSAFLALPRHDWIISLGKKSGKIVCVHKKCTSSCGVATACRKCHRGSNSSWRSVHCSARSCFRLRHCLT